MSLPSRRWGCARAAFAPSGPTSLPLARTRVHGPRRLLAYAVRAECAPLKREELGHLRLDCFHPLVTGHTHAMVAVLHEVRVPYLVQPHRRQG